MLTRMARLLVVKATAGADAPERCSQAFTVAEHRGRVRRGRVVLADRRVDLVRAAGPGRRLRAAARRAAARPAGLLIDAGRVTACTQCAARRGITPDDVLPGIRIAGAAVFVEEIMSEGAQALVY